MSEEHDNPVGYGNPPRQHRVKKDEVRNPWGRKGKPRQEVDFLDQPFKLKIDGKSVTVTRDEALDHALFKEGIAGNVSAIKRLEERRRARARAAKAGSNDERFASEDQRAFDRYLDRALRDRATGGDGGRDQTSLPRPDAAGDPA